MPWLVHYRIVSLFELYQVFLNYRVVWALRFIPGLKSPVVLGRSSNMKGILRIVSHTLGNFTDVIFSRVYCLVFLTSPSAIKAGSRNFFVALLGEALPSSLAKNIPGLARSFCAPKLFHDNF